VDEVINIFALAIQHGLTADELGTDMVALVNLTLYSGGLDRVKGGRSPV
jgi:hypothetical protein